MAVDLYIDLLKQNVVRGPTSAAPAVVPDFRNPASYTVNLYFLRRADATTENYAYTRFSAGTPQLKLRRNRAPEYSTFVIYFNGYESPVIDARLGNTAIEALLGAIPSIGKGNVRVTGSRSEGWTVEFTNEQAGTAQPSLNGRVITPTSAELIIKTVQVGGSGINSMQTVQLREASLAVATGWTEIGVPFTPGWSATLNTASVPPSTWDKADLVLEVTLESTGVRTGTDGVTLIEGTTRSGADGQIIAEAALASQTAMPMIDSDGYCWLVARRNVTVYGRAFSDSDLGRPVSDSAGVLYANTIIDKVLATGDFNMARLSQPFAIMGVDQTLLVTYQLDAWASRVYKSATAAFTSADIGHAITGANIPVGAYIESVIDATTVVLSATPTAYGSSLAWQITAGVQNIFQSATAAFTSADVGARLEATQLPAGTYIIEYLSATQVRISQRPFAVATGQSWTLRPKSGFPAATVTSVTTGSLTTLEQQRISFTKPPSGGSVTVRDGADPSLPSVTVPAPVTAQNLRRALLSAYPNYGDISVVETVEGGDFLITWGTLGKQYTLVVSESPAQYDPLAARMSVGAQGALQVVEEQPDMPMPPQPGVPTLLRMGLKMLGINNQNFKTMISQPLYVPLNDGSGGWEGRARWIAVLDTWTPPAFGEANGSYYFDHLENVEDKGGYRLYDWVGYSIPPGRTEVLQQNRPVYTVPKSWLNGVLVDMQIASVTVSTWVNAIYTYRRIATQHDMDTWSVPADGPFGSIIHFVSIGGFSGAEMAFAGNGFDVGDNQHAGRGTYGLQFAQNWTRRRWRSNIWEQVIFFN